MFNKLWPKGTKNIPNGRPPLSFFSKFIWCHFFPLPYFFSFVPLSINNYQLSITNCQLSIINCQLSFHCSFCTLFGRRRKKVTAF